MSNSMYKDIEDFHVKFGLAYEGKPRMLNEEMTKFRLGFLQEELDEYGNAIGQAQSALDNLNILGPEEARKQFNAAMELQLDALVDLVYVALGDAHLRGFDFEEAWRRVHEKNMAKVRAERADQSTRGTAYDVVKPPGWTPPSHADLVEDNAHNEVFTK